uniref:Uncharacterized protein n=1 Tax=Anopheles funestus TaxID=62324 RepID=A0A4Y0BK49_ANOFN
MNSTLDCKYEGGEPKENSVTSEYCFENMDYHCAQCCNSSEYSVKSLRKIFQFNNSNQEATTPIKPSSARIEQLPVCKCKEHTEDNILAAKKPSTEKLRETRSVQELRHLFETKMKSLEHASTSGSIDTYSRPVSGKTDDRQDTISLDPPHPEGQIFKYSELPVQSKPCKRWNITNTSIVEIPNGMQITFTMMNDSKH